MSAPAPSTSGPGPSPRDGVGLLLALGLLLLLLGWTLAFGSGEGLLSRSYGGSPNIDAGSHVWYLHHLKQAALGRGELFHSDRVFYPRGLYLVGQDWEPVVGLLALPFQALGPTAAFNLQFLWAYLLTGLFTFALARRLGCPRGPALLAALAFTFCEYRLLKAHYHGQPGYAHQQFIPLFLLLMTRYFDEGRRRFALGAGAAVFLATFCTPYQLVFLLLATPLLLGHRLAAAALAHRRGHGPRPALEGRRALRFCALSGGAALALALPVVLPNWGVIAEASDALRAFELRQPADLASYVEPLLLPRPERVPLPDDAWGLTWHRPRPDELLDESRIAFQGYTVLGLGLLALLQLARRSAPGPRAPGPGPWLLGAGVFFVLSLGRTVTLHGQPLFDLPFYAALRHLPLIQGVQLPSRFCSMVTLCLALAGAIALSRLLARPALARRPRLARALQLALIGLALLELGAGRLDQLAHARPAVVHAMPGGPVLRRLAEQPGDRAVLTYPPVWEARYHVFGAAHFPPHRLMAEQLVHGKPILTGMGDAVPMDALALFSQDPFLDLLIRISHGESPPAPTDEHRRWARAARERFNIGHLLLFKGDDYRFRDDPERHRALPIKYYTFRAEAFVARLLPLRRLAEDARHILLEVAR